MRRWNKKEENENIEEKIVTTVVRSEHFEGRSKTNTFFVDKLKEMAGVFNGVSKKGENAESASNLAKEVIIKLLDNQMYELTNISNSLQAILKNINSNLLEKIINVGEKMAVSASLVKIHKDDDENSRLIIANIGNTRVYIKKINRPIEKVTIDDSKIQKLVIDGKEIQNNVLTQWLGKEEIEVSLTIIPEMTSGDKILLCTGGLYKNMTNEEINGIFDKSNNSNQIADELISKAKTGIQKDDITVIIMEIN